MATWKSASYSRAAVRRYLERVGLAILVAGFLLGALLRDVATERVRRPWSFEIQAALAILGLLYAWYEVRREPREGGLPPSAPDSADLAHFSARQAERERTIGHR